MTKPRVFKILGEGAKEPLHYTECGLDNIFITNGYVATKTPFGDAISVKHVDELHRAIGLYLARDKKVLRGKEVRYLRTHMHMPQTRLGRLLGYSAQQVARWEKEQSQIPGAAERLLRLIYLRHIGDAVETADLLSHIDEMEDAVNEQQMFRQTREGWKAA